MSDVRRRIAATVDAEPGIHFSALVRRLSIAHGQAQHHLRRLGECGRVVRHECRGRTHYFPPEIDRRERELVALLRRETAAAVARALIASGPARPSALAEALGLPRSTLQYHVDALEGAGVLRRDHRGGRRVVLEPVDPAELRAALALATRSPTETAVDRFERLLDGLVGRD